MYLAGVKVGSKGSVAGSFVRRSDREVVTDEVKWAARVLQHSPRGRATKGSILQKLRERLDQLPQCRRFINDFLRDVEPVLQCQEILKTKGLSQNSVDECRPLIAAIPNSYVCCGLTHWLERHLLLAKTLGLHEIGMPISSDTIESSYGVAKIHGTGRSRMPIALHYASRFCAAQSPGKMPQRFSRFA
jgi:hypothetical protein